MAIIKQDKCIITGINKEGCGTSFVENNIIEIPYTIPQDEILFDQHKYRSQSNYVISSIITSSADRVIPECEYFTRCGGCSLQHLSKNIYTKFKQDLVDNISKELNLTSQINEVVYVGKALRRRVIFKAINKIDNLFLGFYQLNSHKINNIDHCSAATDEISNLIPELKLFLRNILPLSAKADITVLQTYNGLILKIYGTNITDTNKYIDILTSKHNVISIKHNDDILYQSEKPYILLDSVEVEIDEDIFLQPTIKSDEILLNIVMNYVSKDRPYTIIDLFCGIGTYTMALSKNNIVVGVDNNAKALNILKSSSQKAKRGVRVENRDLCLNPLSAKELNEFEVIIINPPRAGAKNQIECITKSSSRFKIIYVSCNPQSFKVDAKILLNSGYTLQSITPIDQFHWTQHLELIALFE